MKSLFSLFPIRCCFIVFGYLFACLQSTKTSFLKLLTAKQQFVSIYMYWLLFKRFLKARLQFKTKIFICISLFNKCFEKVRSSLCFVLESIKGRQQSSTLRSEWEKATSRSLIWQPFICINSEWDSWSTQNI